MNNDPEEAQPDTTANAKSEQQVMDAYDELLDHFADLGAEPTEADHEWAKQVSPNSDKGE